MKRKLAVSVAIGGVLAACLLPAIDLSGKTCPCAAPLTCDMSANRCVGALVMDTGTDGRSGDGGGCPVGRGDCDGNPANGCETDFTTDPSHCGYCGHVCPARANAFPACVSNECTIGCNSGFDNCDGDNNNGCEKPVANDPTNCGACKHDCQGAACQNSICDPVQLASATRAHCLLTSQADLYFGTEAGTIVRLPGKVAGTPATIVTQTSWTEFCDLATDGSYLYWSEFGSSTALRRCVLPACSGGETPLVSVPNYGLTGTTDGVYYRRAQAVGFFAKGIDAGLQAQEFSIQSGYGLRVDGKTFFTGLGGSFTLQIVSRDTSLDAGGDAMTVVVAQPTEFAVDGAAVYFTSGSGVFRCNRPGCGSQPTLMTNKGGPYNLVATDGVHVYFTFSGTASNGFTDGAILRCPVLGCPLQGPLMLARTQPRPGALVVDAASVYWSSLNEPPSTGGRVMKVAK